MKPLIPKRTNKKRGQVVIAISIIILAVLIGSTSVISYVKTNSDAIIRLDNERTSKYLAEAGIAKTVWCLNHDTDADCGGTAGSDYPGEFDVNFGNGTFTTTITNDGPKKIIISTGTTKSNTEKTLRVDVEAVADSTDVSFSFAMQVGDGGVEMGNNSTVDGAGGDAGNVYSNSSIECGNNSRISGSVKIAGVGNQIDGCYIGYDSSGNLVNDEADAWAHTLINCRVARDIYHPSGGSNSCLYGLGSQGGTLYSDSDLPPPQEFPITDQMIAAWEAEALAGGIISGDYSPSNGETLGPVKIEGDLTLNNNVTLNVGGIIWVEGDILANNNITIQLLSSFGPNSSMIIADYPADQSAKGLIDINNNITIEGSGDPESYLMLLSTKTGTAIDIKNNSSGSIYVSTQGEIKIKNNAALKAIMAYELDMSNNTTLTYESGLLDTNFVSSSTVGGSWKVKRETWQVIN